MSVPLSDSVDLLIIGGGINGVGIARDASGRGLRVALCEMGDLAEGTSSASSKLVHGGLRYLEQFEFRLVREALAEREVLLRTAPHIVRPMRFLIPHVPELRPIWMMRAGLFLYDRLSRRVTLPASSSVDLTTSALGAAFKPGLRRGFLYSDCWVDDARLVVINARDAADHGARILTRTKFTSATPAGSGWRVCLQDSRDRTRTEIHAKAMVNAAGPWLTNTLNALPGAVHHHRVRLVKGSHIVVPRLYPGDHALILQNDDERVVFVIPFEEDFSLIGTTDVAVDSDPGSVAISDDEVDYLCRAVNRYLASAVTADEVVWSYAGVRPLFDDGAAKASEVSRDYALELDRAGARPPLLSVYGGKLTTYRKLAQRALDMLSPVFPGMGPEWTADHALPGGALGEGGIDALLGDLHDRFPAMDEAVIKRLVQRHGSLTAEVLAGSGQGSAARRHFGADLYAFEVDYLMRREWAQCADDVLWRRTKTGLRLNAASAESVGTYMQLLASVPG